VRTTDSNCTAATEAATFAGGEKSALFPHHSMAAPAVGTQVVLAS